MAVENRIFEDANSFEVADKNDNVEFAVWNGDLHVIGEEGYSERTQFVLTPAEATALKNFLGKQGF